MSIIAELITQVNSNTEKTLDELIYQNSSNSEVTIVTLPNQVVTATHQDSIVFSKTANSDGIVVFKLGLGIWNIQAEKNYKIIIEQLGRLYMFPKENLNLDSLSWDFINIIAQKGLAQQYFKIGDTKTIYVGEEVLLAEIVDFNHDDLVTGGKAKITFGLKTPYYELSGVAGSTVVSNLDSFYTSLLNRDLVKQIKQVKKYTTEATTERPVTTKNEYLWTFSSLEMGFDGTNVFAGEGTKYPIFTDNTSRIRYAGPGAVGYWLRTVLGGTSPMTIVNGAGALIAVSAGSSTSRINFGFCI